MSLLDIAHLALGLTTLLLGAAALVWRERIVAHGRRRGRSGVPTVAWAAFGVLLLLTGAVQLGLAFT